MSSAVVNKGGPEVNTKSSNPDIKPSTEPIQVLLTCRVTFPRNKTRCLDLASHGTGRADGGTIRTTYKRSQHVHTQLTPASQTPHNVFTIRYLTLSSHNDTRTQFWNLGRPLFNEPAIRSGGRQGRFFRLNHATSTAAHDSGFGQLGFWLFSTRVVVSLGGLWLHFASLFVLRHVKSSVILDTNIGFHVSHDAILLQDLIIVRLGLIRPGVRVLDLAQNGSQIFCTAALQQGIRVPRGLTAAVGRRWSPTRVTHVREVLGWFSLVVLDSCSGCHHPGVSTST
mmetsp:Transcript_64816/g.179167  ORF Transcript_64816/g.179167 Transcript_64816/m.179167 type:complete len:282 (-) Transcript_64816:40-885(-)